MDVSQQVGEVRALPSLPLLSPPTFPSLPPFPFSLPPLSLPFLFSHRVRSTLLAHSPG